MKSAFFIFYFFVLINSTFAQSESGSKGNGAFAVSCPGKELELLDLYELNENGYQSTYRGQFNWAIDPKINELEQTATESDIFNYVIGKLAKTQPLLVRAINEKYLPEYKTNGIKVKNEFAINNLSNDIGKTLIGEGCVFVRLAFWEDNGLFQYYPERISQLKNKIHRVAFDVHELLRRFSFQNGATDSRSARDLVAELFSANPVTTLLAPLSKLVTNVKWTNLASNVPDTFVVTNSSIGFKMVYPYSYVEYTYPRAACLKGAYMELSTSLTRGELEDNILMIINDEVKGTVLEKVSKRELKKRTLKVSQSISINKDSNSDQVIFKVPLKYGDINSLVWTSRDYVGWSIQFKSEITGCDVMSIHKIGLINNEKASLWRIRIQ